MANRLSIDASIYALVLAVLGAAGCGASESRPDETEGGAAAVGDTEPVSAESMTMERRFQIADTVQRLRGIMVMGELVEVMRLCGSSEESWVHDRTGHIEQAIRDLELEPYQAFFVDLRASVEPPFTAGPGADYRTKLEVAELLEATVDTTRCDQVAQEMSPDAAAQEALPMGDSELMASGNEPFWNVQVSADGIVLARMGEDDIVFPYSQPRVADGRRVYSSSVEAPAAHEIEIVVEEEPCSDTMSGARFTHVAAVTLDGQLFNGCARLASD